MRNKNNTIYYKDYLTGIQSEIRDRIIEAKQNNRDILFVSDTGSGKTTLAMQLANDFVKEHIETGIVVPLQSIVKSKEGSNEEMDFGSGKYFTLHNELTNNLIHNNDFFCSLCKRSSFGQDALVLYCICCCLFMFIYLHFYLFMLLLSSSSVLYGPILV